MQTLTALFGLKCVMLFSSSILAHTHLTGTRSVSWAKLTLHFELPVRKCDSAVSYSSGPSFAWLLHQKRHSMNVTHQRTSRHWTVTPLWNLSGTWFSNTVCGQSQIWNYPKFRYFANFVFYFCSSGLILRHVNVCSYLRLMYSNFYHY